MSWVRALRKLNAAEGQKAEDAVDSHTDATISLELSIQEAEKNCEALRATASRVIADGEVNRAKLTRMDRELELAKNNARAALAVEADATAKGDTAKAQQAHAQAVMMAQQVASIQAQIETQTALCAQSDANAETARQRIAEEMEALQEAHSRRDAIQNKIDAAKAEQAMANSMASLTGANATLTPSMDQVEAKADAALAKAHAETESSAANPGAMSLDVHHESLQLQAEDILRQLGQGQ